MLSDALLGKEKESEVAQSCPTFCDPMDCSLPGSSLHGILQARVLDWVAISFSAVILLQEEKSLPGPMTKLLSNILKWIVQRDTSADKAKDWEVMPGQRPVGKGTPETSR